MKILNSFNNKNIYQSFIKKNKFRSFHQKTQTNQIIKINSFVDIFKDINKFNSKDLVCFSGDVLITSQERIAKEENLSFLRDEIRNRLPNKSEQSAVGLNLTIDSYVKIVYSKAKDKILHPSTLILNQHLNEKRIKNLAASELNRLPYAPLSERLERELKRLNNCGFHFKDHFQFVSPKSIKHCQFKDGLLGSYKVPMGISLSNLIKITKMDSSKVILIDNCFYSACNFSSTMENLGINSLVYCIEEKKQEEDVSENPIIHLQIEHLVKNEELLSESEIISIFNRNFSEVKTNRHYIY